MKNKQLLGIKLNLLSSKTAIESTLIRDFDPDDLNLLGYLNYIELNINNITSNYKTIKEYIEMFYFKTKDIPDYWEDIENNLTEFLLGCTEENATDIFVLTKELPSLVVEFIQKSDQLEASLTEGFNKFFPSLKRYKLIGDEMIEMTEDEILHHEIEQQREAIEASYSVDAWGKFYDELITLIKEEKYVEILNHIGM